MTTSLPLPEGLWVLCSVSRLVGVDDLLKILRDFQQFIDTDELRRVGTEVWGTSGRPAIIGQALDDLAPSIVDTFLRTVENRWQGEAFEAFYRYVQGIRKALHQEADRLPRIGDVLVTVADAIELTWLELIGAATSAAGLVLSAQSVYETGPTLLGLIGLAVSLVGALVSVIAIERLMPYARSTSNGPAFL